MTREQLAIIMGISRQRVHQLEHDGCMHVGLLQSWAAAIGMDPASLMFGGETDRKVKVRKVAPK